MPNSLKKGFTLIELLIVMGIIAILVALGGVNFRASQFRARDAQRKSDLKQISTALRLYYNDNNQYPATSASIPWGAQWAVGTTIYMNKVPQDVIAGRVYRYERTDADNFTLSACLEYANDPAGVSAASYWPACPGGVMFQIKT